ncbi:hypothetical protein AKJ09_01571 [Labilithrix luteola]|uniref:IgGFc-binding protein N-terminal domain-containing protein n=1 Tax=Labilithrix luteola TaxID=1391654 RepID=A0A0K1PN15_9BACT|nr:hypothetical protein AKJ09_01571 [Labilithrix luteola]
MGLVSFAIAATIGACSTDRAPFDPGDNYTLAPDASTPDVACGFRCSRDLKTVLSACQGSDDVLFTCGADEGCGDGRCVPACEAAKLSKGSAGCDFWTLPVDSGKQSKGSCFAAMISNTWDRPVTLTAEYGGDPLDVSQSVYTVDVGSGTATYARLDGPLPSGQVAIVFLSAAPDTTEFEGILCPQNVTPAVKFDPIAHGTSRTKAFRLITDAPVSAYSIFPYGGASTYVPTATLLLPVSSWEKDYVAVSPFAFGFPSERTLQIVANQNDTVVSIRPNTEIPAGYGVEGATTGITQSWTLARGEVLQFTQENLTGSPISASNPVGIFGGSRCTYVPGDYGACDVLQQQISPTSQWGDQYALVPYPTRAFEFSSDSREFVPYTLVSAADGTVFSYDPVRPAGAPEKLDAGQSATFKTDELVVVRSQDSKHPFHASVYMTGQDFGGGLGGLGFRHGDPDFVTLAASDQFLDHYVFFTDYTFPETRLTIVRRKTAKGFLPVELECAGVIEGFQPVGTSGEFEYAWVTLTASSAPVKFPKGECGYGRQEAKSDGPFSINVWGLGYFASYGYLAGTGLRPINDFSSPVLK